MNKFLEFTFSIIIVIILVFIWHRIQDGYKNSDWNAAISDSKRTSLQKAENNNSWVGRKFSGRGKVSAVSVVQEDKTITIGISMPNGTHPESDIDLKGINKNIALPINVGDRISFTGTVEDLDDFAGGPGFYLKDVQIHR